MRWKLLGVVMFLAAAPETHAMLVTVVPAPYPRALRNPLKGLTKRSLQLDGEWTTLTHHYIGWGEIENSEADTIDKIRAFCDEKWKGLPRRNVKVIPRVYLHWTDNKKHWPADLTPDDYTSEKFKARLLRLVGRLGELWNRDPRVAFVEMGIFGKWGEHHSPSPTKEMQVAIGEAFRKAFPDKLVSVRHAWSEFVGFGFGEYWDSWAHYQQMWAHGKELAELNVRTGLWKTAYIGGEVAYDWGLSKTQPGDSPTDSLADPAHLDFIINSVRWLHCTQLRWIGDYDANDARAREGAEALQKALGYRFELERVRFSPEVHLKGRLRVEFDVRNVGSAPFYYQWPVEVALLEPNSRDVVWKAVFKNADVRKWLPGDRWTEPEWVPIKDWPGKAPRLDWSGGPKQWVVPPVTYTVSEEFEVRAPPGRYVLTLAVLDPAGMLPSLRFATANYWRGGRHPVGIVAVGMSGGGKLPAGFPFDDPHTDDSLHYVVDRR